jgi:hypothetical protein
MPFANPTIMPHEYKFYWKRRRIPATTTEGPPEDFYPFYTVFGEEYAPQYVARDNSENENAFNSDPYEDPAEVSIHTLDMRNLYRETAFVPGDRFVVRTKDWKAGVFDLKKVDKDEWPQSELYAWFEAAEIGFHDSFERFGPGSSTDDQIAYAYWYGGKRMREVPAYSLEEYLYEKTETVDVVPYGIETRFWGAGKEIPDLSSLKSARTIDNRTYIEEVLYRAGVPISEYVIQAYAKDALFRNDMDMGRIVDRIVPRTIVIEKLYLHALATCVREALDKFEVSYTVFTDRLMGPIRQRVGELHTAVIDLSARLLHSGVDSSWFPKHTFIVLSQIQNHAAAILENLSLDEAPPDSELETFDNSLDSMIETYEDIKELVDDALDSFRRNNLSVVKKSGPGQDGAETLQISLGGTDIWRRIVLPASCRLSDLHRIIQILFGWDRNGEAGKNDDEEPRGEEAGSSPQNFKLYQKSSPQYQYSVTRAAGVRRRGLSDKPPRPGDSLEELRGRGVNELLYEYGNQWTVKILFFNSGGETVIVFPGSAGSTAPIRCVAGEGAPPPPSLDGPLSFRKFLAACEQEKTSKYDPAVFDLAELNRQLAVVSLSKK